jgi:stage II sporulation protein D
MKKIIIGILSFILFIILLSILITGIGSSKEISFKEDLKINYNVKKIRDTYSSEELSIDVYISKDKRIDNMNIEEYVIGVVAAEMPAEFELDALKAQAVAARTYGLAHKEEFGAGKSPKAFGADVNDTVEFQAFMYKEDRFKLWPEKYREKYWDKLLKAVEETKGEVLLYNDELVMAPYYFSTSSGKTEDSAEVFSKGQPYLKSVESKGEERSPKYSTEVNYSYEQLVDILNKSSTKWKLQVKSLNKQILILERSSGGSVTKIRIGNEEITGSKFRSLLNLNSSNFEIKYNKNQVIITCKGYGHGVGMSQWGADAMAKEGYDYKEILEYYYRGVKISRLVTSDR